jgi:hypothetical protein
MSVVDLQSRKPRRKRPLHPDRWEHSLLVGLDWRSREAKVLVVVRPELTAMSGAAHRPRSFST